MPVYCESEGIANLLAEVDRVLNDAGAKHEFILIDDGSLDDTWMVLNELAGEFPELRAARLSRNFGKDLALCAGLEMADGDAIIVMDADGQHPPSILPEMIAAWRGGGVDIVDAVKLDRGKETVFSKISATLFYLIWNKLSGFELRGASDFKLIGRNAVDAYLTMQDRNVFFRGMTAWVGFRRKQVPFSVPARSGGRTSWTTLRLLKFALTGITAFSAVPLQLVTLAGIVFLLFAIVFGLQTLYVYLSGQAMTGFSTVILLLLIIGSLLMISLGIIGEYIARIYEEVKGRPRYIIAEKIGPSNASLGFEQAELHVTRD